MDETIKLTFVGDVMCQKSFLDAFRQNGHFAFDSAFAKIKKMLEQADFACANLETPISFNNTNLTGELYNFNSPLEFADSVKKAGFNFVATANNHCLDRGVDGIASTVKSLDSVGLFHTGVFSNKNQDRSILLDVQGVKVGFLSYTYGTNAFNNNNYLRWSEHWKVNLLQSQELSNPISRYCFHHGGGRASRIYNKVRKLLSCKNYGCQVYERKECDWFQRRRIKADIQTMKKAGADIIVFYLHIGGQYNEKETDRTLKTAEFLSKQGVNIIVGSHEHVVHGSSNKQMSENSVETYSLGNFLDTTGVTTPPFDKMSEYSIAWHVYIEKQSKRISKTSYTICKTVLQEGENQKVEVVPVYDLLESECDAHNKQQLWQDMQEIALRFSGQKIENPQFEYFY